MKKLLITLVLYRAGVFLLGGRVHSVAGPV